jgi:hypothetical protein
VPPSAGDDGSVDALVGRGEDARPTVSRRVEQHCDIVSGVCAGRQNNVQLAQVVKGVQAGATYELKFDVAGTDLRDSESLTVTCGVRWCSRACGRVRPGRRSRCSGSGDGSDRLVFAQTSGSLEGAR